MKSKKRSKQRKMVFEAKLHERNKLMSARLSDELTKKYKMRNIPARKGDKVKIVRGKYKGTTGKINKVDTKRLRVFIDGADRPKIDGSKSFYPLRPSKLIILELNLDDKKRLKQLKRKEG
jgi:large subunit ribosomal protein L24